ncbi:MAG: DNA gyrase inhibitor YacG [Blastocatellia bacterium]
MTRRCPLCRRETIWEVNPWRPFCSERCQTIDLANWASEGYRVTLTETPEGLLPAEFAEFMDIDSDLENNFDEQK